MRKVRFGLDIDGVLYRWSDTARYLLKTYCDVDPGESETWNWIKDHISREAWTWLWSQAITEHGLFRYGSIYTGSREFLQRIEPYCDNVIITSRPALAVRDTMDWLSYQKVPTTEVHIINNAPKSSIQPQCDVYIDDALHNIQDLIENTTAHTIMPDKPWNQGSIYVTLGMKTDLIGRTFTRTSSWEEIEDVIHKIHTEINA